MKIKFKPIGRRDYMDFQWYGAYDENNNPIYVQGEHLSFQAKDETHAMRMYNQIRTNDSSLNKQ
jgi:hypothetical protein